MSSTRRLLAISVVGAAMTVGCSSASPAASPSAAFEPTGTQAAIADCAHVDLRSPSGSRVDLTGLWVGSGVHVIRQDGGCVGWVGLSDDPGEDLGSSTVTIFRGEVGSNFTVAGEWMAVHRGVVEGEPRRGQVTFRIEFTSVDGAETVTLVSTEPSHQDGGRGPYASGVRLLYEFPLPP